MPAPRRVRELAGRLRHTVAAPVPFALAGGALGALLAATALAVDALARWELSGVVTASVRTMFGALLGGAITATAVLFWVRGMIVQLAATELSPRVLRRYLNDTYLHLAFAFLLAVFTHSLVTLLWLPPRDVQRVPAVSSLSGAVLAFLALVLIVHAVYDSVRAMSPSRVLTAMTADALALIRRSYPPDRTARSGGTAPGADAGVPAPEDAGEPLGRVRAARRGWVIEVDHARVATGLPPGGVAWLRVTSGDFVDRGGTLATVSARAAARGWNPAAIAGGFTIADERRVRHDAEHALYNFITLALQNLGTGTADRLIAFEALRCLALLLGELLRRAPWPAVGVHDGHRLVVPRLRRSHGDMVRATVGELRRGAQTSPEFQRSLLDELERLAVDLRRDGSADAAHAVAEQAAAVRADLDATDAVRAAAAAGDGGRAPVTPGADQPERSR